MATKTKRTQLGNYITKHNGYDIRQKYTMKKNDKGNMVVGGSELVVCKGKKTVKGGFKNQQTAKVYIDSLK
jgi:hypothetical protein